MSCDFCGSQLRENGSCRSCELYNAAVAAMNAAARSIANASECDPLSPAWLNEYGIFGWRDGVLREVGTPEEAALFSGLTQAARNLKREAKP